MARKLTHKHLYLPAFSSMSVRLAAQVFSNSVAVGINTLVQCQKLDSTAIYTARFVKKRRIFLTHVIADVNLVRSL